MDNELKLLAAEENQKAYKNNIDLGSMEYALTIREYNDRPMQFLSMPGSNEWYDWLLNFFLKSKDGVKYCTYIAAKRVYEHVQYRLDPNIPLCVNGHSKAGPDALRYMQKYGADYCIAFCPPPAFVPETKPVLENTLIVIDPDDIVPLAGGITFDQPYAPVEYLPDDKAGFDLSDHVIDHVVDYYKNIS